MDTTELQGLALVILSGLLGGTGAWPLKLIRRFRFEQWALLGNLAGLLVFPWLLVIALHPNVFGVLGRVDGSVLLRANLFSLAWGVANVCSLLALVRIGVSMSSGLLTGIGLPIGVIIPMVFKAPGQFEDAPDLFSRAGFTVLAGVGIMLVAVVIMVLAGFARDRQLDPRVKSNVIGTPTKGSFAAGLALAVACGLLQAGLAFSFIYTEGPVGEAMKKDGAGAIASTLAVWAISILSGAIVNIGFQAWLLTRNRTWGGLVRGGRDTLLIPIMGLTTVAFLLTMGSGMKALGVMGASVGFGVYQSLQITGSQVLGFATGEWRSVGRGPKLQMLLAVAILLLAAAVIAYGNSLAKA